MLRKYWTKGRPNTTWTKSKPGISCLMSKCSSCLQSLSALLKEDTSLQKRHSENHKYGHPWWGTFWVWGSYDAESWFVTVAGDRESRTDLCIVLIFVFKTWISIPFLPLTSYCQSWFTETFFIKANNEFPLQLFFFAFCFLFYSSRPRLKLNWRSKTIAKFPDTRNCLPRHPCASASSALPYTETVSFSTWQRLNSFILLH